MSDSEPRPATARHEPAAARQQPAPTTNDVSAKLVKLTKALRSLPPEVRQQIQAAYRAQDDEPQPSDDPETQVLLAKLDRADHAIQSLPPAARKHLAEYMTRDDAPQPPASTQPQDEEASIAPF